MTTPYPCVWFDGQALQALEFYASIFPNSHIITQSGRAANGEPLIVEMNLNGQKLVALNGGQHFTLSPAFSLVIECDSQDEIDHYWYSLSDNGKESMCGWLVDAFGLSWQVVPRQLGKLLYGGSDSQNEKAVKAMLGMKKLIIDDLIKARNL